MGRMESLKVERVDAVDKPATGLSWVVVKSETPVEKTEAAARAILEALAKAGVELPEDAVSALKAMAELLDLDYEFERTAEPEADATEKDADEADEPEVEKDEDTEEEADVDKDEDDSEDEPDLDAPLTRKTLGPALAEALADFAKAEEEQARKGEGTARLSKSKQPKDNEKTVEKGSGLYTDVIFGQ